MQLLSHFENLVIVWPTCDALLSAFQDRSAMEKTEALNWRMLQDESLLSNIRPVWREDAFALVTAVIRRKSSDRLLHKCEFSTFHSVAFTDLV